jgi:hypothetical protein
VIQIAPLQVIFAIDFPYDLFKEFARGHHANLFGCIRNIYLNRTRRILCNSDRKPAILTTADCSNVERGLFIKIYS